MLIIKYLIGGFISKILASFDDAVTRIPIIAQLTKTLKGRIAFALGNFFAVTVAIFLAWFFSSIVKNFPYANLITSILILLLAIAVYFDLFEKKNNKKIKKEKHEIKKKISSAKFLRLTFLGFVISLVTLLDDFIVLSPLFLGNLKSDIFALIGIYTATLLQLIIMIYLAKKISKLKYVKEVAVIGLIILAILVYLEIF